MDCRHSRRVISALLDHELPPEAAARARAHLDRCPQCRDLYAAYQEDAREIASFARTAPWLPVADRMRAQLPTYSHRARWQQRATQASRLTARIALVVLLLLIGMGVAVIRNTARNHTHVASPTGVALNVAALVTPTTATDNQQTFSDANLNATLTFPASWYQRYNSDIISFESTNAQNRLGYSFLALSGLDGASLDAVCQSNAYEPHHSYGTTPRIEQWNIQGQPACLIFPSADQQDPHGGFAAVIVQAPQPFRLPASPTHNYLALRVDTLHFRTVVQTLRFLQFPVAKADVVWNTVALDARGLLEVWNPAMAPGGFATVQGAPGIVGGQHNSYQVEYDGSGKRLSMGIGPFVPPAGPSQQVTVRGHQGILTTTADGHLALTWNEIAAPNDPAAVSHYLSFVTAEGVPAAEVQAVADSLRPMQQPPDPPLLSHEQRGRQSFEGTDFDPALSTFKEFMEARIARDPQQAFAYLNGDTRAIDYNTMLPTGNAQWQGYDINTADRAPDGSVHIRVGIAERDTTTAALHTFMKEQTATLQQQGNRWIITALSPLATISETNAATPLPARLATSAPPGTTIAQIGSALPVAWETEIWDGLARDPSRTTPLLKPGTLPAGFETVTLNSVSVGTAAPPSFSVTYAGPGKTLHIRYGAVNPPPGNIQPLTVQGRRAMLVTFPDGHVSLRIVDGPRGDPPKDSAPLYVFDAYGLSIDAMLQLAKEIVEVPLTNALPSNTPITSTVVSTPPRHRRSA